MVKVMGIEWMTYVVTGAVRAAASVRMKTLMRAATRAAAVTPVRAMTQVRAANAGTGFRTAVNPSLVSRLAPPQEG
jgi:hypothetical protein